MQVSSESYPNSGVYAMRHLEMYMGDVDKWNPGFKKFNVSLRITLWFIIMFIFFYENFLQVLGVPVFFPPLQEALLKKLRVKYCYSMISSEENVIRLQIMDKVKAYYDSMRKEEQHTKQPQRRQSERLKDKAVE